MKIKVKAKRDTDFCKKWDIILMKEWVFKEFHKDNFEIVKTKTLKSKKKRWK